MSLFPALCQECEKVAPEYWSYLYGHLCPACWESLPAEEVPEHLQQ